MDEASGPKAFSSDQQIFETILSLLYLTPPARIERGGTGVLQFERDLKCASENLEFHIWYLIEKRFIHRLENGLLSITAHGVDSVIAQDKLSLRQDRLIADSCVSKGYRSNSHELELELTNGR